MSQNVSLTIDGQDITAEAGQMVLKAADAAGVYIPRLCAHPDLKPFGSCRLCTIMANGRPASACTTPVAEGMVIENDTEQLNDYRRSLVEMLFVEGNHFCMFCEKSGNCELQALAYRLGIMAPRYPYQNPDREIDASHPDIMLDRNRCILCARCVRASRDVDGKNVFQFVGRGSTKRIGVNAEACLVNTDADLIDTAMDVCPVGAILKKHVGFAVPVGERLYDHEPIGSEISGQGG